MSRRQQFLSCICVGSLMAFACVPIDDSAPTPFNPSRTSPETVAVPTLAPTHIPTQPTLSTEAKATPTTPRATPTREYPSSQDVDELGKTVIDWITSGQSCPLPCLFGQQAGVTGRADIDDFMARYQDSQSRSTYLSQYKDPVMGGFVLLQRRDSAILRVSLDYSFPESAVRLSRLSLHLDSYHENTISDDWLSPDMAPSYGDPVFQLSTSIFGPARLVQGFGTPTDVLVYVAGNDIDDLPDTEHHFSTVFVYQTLGFFVEYVMLRQDASNVYQGCLEDAQIRVSTWSVDSGLTLTEIAERGGDVFSATSLDSYRKLSDISDLQIADLISILQNGSSNPCIETPKSHWDIS